MPIASVSLSGLVASDVSYTGFLSLLTQRVTIRRIQSSLLCRLHAAFCFDEACGGVTLVAGVARLGVFFATY